MAQQTRSKRRSGTTNGERPVVTIGFGGGSPAQDHGLQWAQCRQGALGHEWKHDRKPMDPELNRWHYQPPVSFGLRDVFGTRSVCNFCGTVKVVWFNARTHERTSPRYFHPEGYSRRGEEALDTEGWRSVWSVQMLADFRRNGENEVHQASRTATA